MVGIGFDLISSLSEKTRIVVTFVIFGIIAFAIIIYYLKKIISKIKQLIIKNRNKKLDKEEELFCINCQKISKKKYFCSRCGYNLRLRELTGNEKK